MPLLHPDKLVGITRAIQGRPPRPRPGVAVAAQRAAGKPKPLVKGKSKVAPEPGLIENLAFHLRQEYEDRHLDRLARRVDRSLGKSQKAPATGAGKPQSAGKDQPAITIAVQGGVPARPPARMPGIRFL